ncbi:hypothetical protein D2V93_11935 [Flagellimonas taeanensis]|jgi:hypothetical protein|uniref:DUF6249 domain-containing protein n=1 Tax=Flagellimonas taeanensis TaxID=1005926 RepID=A0A1M6W3L6_9FLAO|nr:MULTISPECIES: DUF6249 domain-containing protein [Allomuricauda]MDC6386685.1 hypothetical protein [Muricauda sp. SK9]MEE1964453.1 DUF6249 domain-containing protein [Allomuricauda taeanensis]RIV50012.1 hypothetical protein D2V93_11935 [Allomuricauda taeanensis]SFC46479.1 hypothetical protein SAMN04487891_111159 [Allomuricauda taeanensis]SHK88340.1 hypothetical protein SAMN05216293_2149 [Allomuricauda taeanensis]
MGSEVIIIPIIFGVIFAIAYLYFSTRNKERLALIEKGADASIFVKGRREGAAPFWKVIILNISLLLIGIGLAIFVASILVYNLGMDDEVAYPGTIFTLAGVGLLVGFTMTKRLEKE